jgi:hypothetical protein
MGLYGPSRRVGRLLSAKRRSRCCRIHQNLSHCLNLTNHHGRSHRDRYRCCRCHWTRHRWCCRFRPSCHPNCRYRTRCHRGANLGQYRRRDQNLFQTRHPTRHQGPLQPKRRKLRLARQAPIRLQILPPPHCAALCARVLSTRVPMRLTANSRYRPAGSTAKSVRDQTLIYAQTAKYRERIKREHRFLLRLNTLRCCLL